MGEVTTHNLILSKNIKKPGLEAVEIEREISSGLERNHTAGIKSTAPCRFRSRINKMEKYVVHLFLFALL